MIIDLISTRYKRKEQKKKKKKKKGERNHLKFKWREKILALQLLSNFDDHTLNLMAA